MLHAADTSFLPSTDQHRIMASFDRTASPVLTLPPASAHHGAFGMQSFSHHQSFHSASWSDTPAHNPYANAPRGRKRSRDEAAINLDPPEKAPPAIEPVHEDEDEWEYGPGMILIKKSTGYVHDASNQSGTWLEERAAEEETRRTDAAVLEQQRQAQDRPSLRSHKSSRLDVSAEARASPGRELGDSPSTILSMATETAAQPVVDDFTLHLGIGWNRLSDDEDIQAAARGWARYIENHFPINDAKIRLKSNGLESYLVEAQEGYFLFAEDLRQGRLVSRDAQQVLHNLKTSPPTFDGPETMVAAESPRPTEVEPTNNRMDMDMN
jgi:hypothetical protein